jgi:hypothetical protein
MRVVRGAMIGIIGIVAALLGGCDHRIELWRKTANDIRVFIAPFPCAALSGKVLTNSATSTFYEMLGSQWWVGGDGDGCRVGLGRRCFPDIPQSYHDKYARRVTFINQQGAAQDAKVWVVNQTNMAPVVFKETAIRHGIPIDIPTAFPPDLKEPGLTCVNLVTIPWRTDQNRPFWVADATLQTNPAPFAANNTFTGDILIGLLVFFILGTFFAGAGHSARSALRSFMFAAASLIVLTVLQQQMISEPYQRLLSVQNYYQFFSKLPRTAWGQFLPISANNMTIFMAGPPLTTALEQPAELFYLIVLFILVLWLGGFGKLAVVGMYYLFVPHRAATYILPALRDEDRIDAGGLADALTPSDESLINPPPAYQSRSQAAKASALKAKLDADAEVAEAAIRRERARAALADAEREVKEAKRRARDI